MLQHLSIGLRLPRLPLLRQPTIVLLAIGSGHAHDGACEVTACSHKQRPRPALLASTTLHRLEFIKISLAYVITPVRYYVEGEDGLVYAKLCCWRRMEPHERGIGEVTCRVFIFFVCTVEFGVQALCLMYQCRDGVTIRGVRLIGRRGRAREGVLQAYTGIASVSLNKRGERSKTYDQPSARIVLLGRHYRRPCAF